MKLHELTVHTGWLPHQLSDVLRRILRLRERQNSAMYQSNNGADSRQRRIPLEALNVLPTDFVIQHMGHLVCRNLLSCRTFVDTFDQHQYDDSSCLGNYIPNHRNSNRPWGITDR